MFLLASDSLRMIDKVIVFVSIRYGVCFKIYLTSLLIRKRESVVCIVTMGNDGLGKTVFPSINVQT
jgi:hypothetical protein